MGWVKEVLKELDEKGQAQIRPQGGSMRGRIESGQLVTLSSVTPEEVVVDDVALVRWKGNYILHIIKEITDDQVLIGNNLGKINGWVPRSDIIAKVTSIEDQPDQSDAGDGECEPDR